jgi:hypothetical protein
MNRPPVFLGPTGALAFMSLGAAGQTATDALERGATTGQAFALGTASGVIEAVTEKIPLDNLFRLAKQGAKGVKPVVTSVLKQAGIEGTEEMISEIAGNVADIVVMRESSNYKQYVEYLRSLGYSKKHAEEEAILQYFIYGTGLAGLGGFVSGGVMGGGAVTLGNIWNDTQIDTVPGLESLLRDGADAGNMDMADPELLDLWLADPESTVNNAYSDYLEIMEELEKARESGMTARDYAKSMGVPSTLTDEEDKGTVHTSE